MKIFKSPSFLVFILITFLIGFPAFYISTRQSAAGIQIILFLLGSYGVAAAVFITLRAYHLTDETGALKSRLKLWHNDPRNYLASIGIPTVIWLLTALIVRLLGNPINASWVGLAGFPVIMITNFGEEIGWRGFVLPRLLTAYRPLKASIILGIIWGIFHFPLYWQRPWFAILFLALTPALSIFITWLFIKTGGSIPLITLFHAVFNTWVQVFLTTNGEQIMAVSVGVSWVLVFLLLARYGSSLSYSLDAGVGG